ncbi:MAG: Ig domain-containing protein [Isosphaeraceae bacterium]|nr:Ig domain-containing protein [Isosphaeraceae bacterium]
MRRSRRGGHSGREFGGSGEDSFVAVVVTKLTGALLFILLLTMVIMALLPKAIDQASKRDGDDPQPPKLAIKSPSRLPEAIVGRPYQLALAAEGGAGSRSWSLDGELPPGLSFDPESGTITGTPTEGTPAAIPVTIRVRDESGSASSTASIVVFRSDRPLSLPSRWELPLPALPWRTWFEQGFGFLLLFLVYLVGQHSLSDLRRWSLERIDDERVRRNAARRHALYKNVVRVIGAAAAVVLGGWLWLNRNA